MYSIYILILYSISYTNIAQYSIYLILNSQVLRILLQVNPNKVMLCFSNLATLPPFFISVPTYCWQTGQTRVKVAVGQTFAPVLVSVSRSGSAYPSYISEQCASFRIRDDFRCKLEMDSMQSDMYFYIKHMYTTYIILLCWQMNFRIQYISYMRMLPVSA